MKNLQRLRETLNPNARQDLTQIRRLQRAFADPDKTYPIVHIAGTNGKGSVAIKIATALEMHGLRVGLFTSPHLSTFRERIIVDDQMITIDEADHLFDQIFHKVDAHSIDLTWFEVLTMMSLLHFADRRVNAAVLETGLGGRLDATNIVSPNLTVITSIDLDHTQLLGSSREAIAREKGGIIKPGVPIVLGPHAQGVGLEEIAQERGAPLILVPGGQADFVAENGAIAETALRTRFNLTQEEIDRGLHAEMPCRLFKAHDQVVLDVAHNPQGLRRLFEALKIRYPDHEICALAGFSKGKDHAAALQVLRDHAHTLHLIDVPHERVTPAHEISSVATQMEIVHEGSGQLHDILPAALKRHQLIVVCGSCYLMHDARKLLGHDHEADTFSFSEVVKG